MPNNVRTNAKRVIIALAAIGSFLPWVSAGILSASGLDGDGIIVLVIALAAIGMTFLRQRLGWRLVDAALALIVLITCIYDLREITKLDNELIEPSPGGGLILCLVAAVAWIGWIAWDLSSARRPVHHAAVAS